MIIRLIVLLSLIPIFSEARVVEGIVAIVNSEYITRSEVEEYRIKLKTGGLIDEAFLNIINPKELVSDDKKLVDFLIDQKLLDSEVKSQNMSVTFERVEKEIRNMAKINNVSRSQLKSALTERGIKFSDYQDFIKTSLERKSLIERLITSKIKISEEDIQSYYISHKGAEESVAFEYKIAHIMTITQKGEARAKEKIARAKEQLDKNIGFEDVAAKFSEDPNFTEGGLLGTFKAGEMLKEIEGVVKNLKVGGHSQIVKSRVGYHIVRLLKKRIVESAALSQEKQKIQMHLTRLEFKKRFKQWLSDKRENSFVRIN